MGILSTGQARHFAMGGTQFDGEPPLDLDKIIVSGPGAPSLRTQLGGTVQDNLDQYPLNENPMPLIPGRTTSIPNGLGMGNNGTELTGFAQTGFDFSSNLLNPSTPPPSPSFGSDYDAYVANANQPATSISPAGTSSFGSDYNAYIANANQPATPISPADTPSFGTDYEAYVGKSPATAASSDTKSFGQDYDAYIADYNKNKGKYRDSQSIEEAYKAGNIAKDERDRLQLLSPEELQKETNTTEKLDQYKTTSKSNNSGMFPYMSPLGTDFTSNMFQAGRAIRAPKGTPGKALGIGLNLGAGFLEAIRGVSSGMAYQNRNDQARNYYDDQMRKRLYTNASQTQNANITGGVSEGRYGGLFQNNHFALGGSFTNPYFAEGGEQMMQEQMAQEEMPQEEMPQEEQAMAQEQVASQAKIQQIAEQLVSGLGSLEAIDAYLKEQQVDEATYNAIMQVAQQLIEGQNQPQVPTEEAPTMRGGGKFKHRVGDKIEFTHKGKKHRGVIKKIENGQIYL
jgi:hypothetical protein